MQSCVTRLPTRSAAGRHGFALVSSLIILEPCAQTYPAATGGCRSDDGAHYGIVFKDVDLRRPFAKHTRGFGGPCQKNGLTPLCRHFDSAFADEDASAFAVDMNRETCAFHYRREIWGVHLEMRARLLSDLKENVTEFLYGYVNNDPGNATDPSGEEVVYVGV